MDIKAELLKSLLKQRFPSKEKIRILDIGCGHGFIHRHFHSAQFNVVGIEVAHEILEHHENPCVSYVRYDGHELPFESKSFDVAIAICVIHHVPPLQ